MFLSAALPDNEAARLARLRALAVLDTEPEAIFDALARAAADACRVPSAMVVLLDEKRQWFKAAIGMSPGLRETPREMALCAHTVLGGDLLEVPDLSRDDRFADNPLVTGPDNMQFYAAAPIVVDGGLTLGTVCVVDHVPRKLDDHQLRTLRHLAAAAAEAFVFRAHATTSMARIEQDTTWMTELYRSTPVPMFSMDTQGRILMVNDRWLAETGYTRDEVNGRLVFELLTAESREHAITVGMPKFLRIGRTVDVEYQLICKDGAVIDVLVSSELERDHDGAPLRSMSTFENITPRRRAEQALRDEQARMERILEGTNAGTWELNVQTGETRYNERWAAIAGFTLAELGQTTGETWRHQMHVDDLPRAVQMCRDHYEGKLDYYNCECRVRHKDGSWIWIRDRGRVSERDADGKPLWMYGTRAEITKRKRAEESLRESQSFLKRVGHVAGIGGWELDFRTGAVVWSEQTCRLHDEPAGHRPSLDQALAYFSAESRAIIENAIQQSRMLGASFDLELPLVSAKGRAFWARAVGSVECENGEVVRLVGAFQDITRRKQMESDLARSRELLQVTLESIGDAVITTDTDSIVQWLNSVAERMTGWTKAEAVGSPLGRVFTIIDEATRLPTQDPVALCLQKAQVVCIAGNVTLVSRCGVEFGIEDSASPIRDADGQVHGAVLVFHDVSEQRRLNHEMSHRATHDLLTGLLNRSEFEDRVARLLDRAGTSPADMGAGTALLYIDLDQFKLVNDACGHAAGDQLLRQVSAILRGCVRGHDTLARLGGDEFGVVLEHCDMHHAQCVAQKVCDQMDEFRFIHDSRRFRIGTSIGLVPLDDRWSGIKALMQAADAACYAAKDGGRNRVHAWFDSDQLLKTRHGDMQWVNRLEVALDEDRFELFGQRIAPITDDGAKRGVAKRGVHFEVLLRLREANGTLVPPGAFLPAAERFHLATRIDRWVVRKSLDWMRVAADADVEVETMAINLSGQSLGDRAFHRDVMQMLRRAPFALQKLCFEVTETAAITHLAEARTFIEEVRSLGVKIALDDFGAGASSFGYLKSLPVDFLKIDGHFVTTLLEDELNNAAVRCFCDVAKVVGVRTIAEFVEREEVRVALGGLGVDMAQGYLVHRPEPLQNLLTREPVRPERQVA
jgi:diguanylate cyclase (GGDEF)-like protein/PAS domain S-box-containing protein